MSLQPAAGKTPPLRRLEAGDWVRPRGPSNHSVGKLIEGRYDPEDDFLVAGLVEIGGRSLWYPAGELVRLTPEEEAALVEAACERGLVRGDHQDRLRTRLGELCAGNLAFVRTPGLLDLLWARSARADPEHGAVAIDTFLDVAADVLRPAEAIAAPEEPEATTRQAVDEPMAEPEPDLDSVEENERTERRRRSAERKAKARAERIKRFRPEVQELARQALEADLEEIRLRQADPDGEISLIRIGHEEDVLPRVLQALEAGALRRVISVTGLMAPSGLASADDLRQLICRADPALVEVVDALDDEELRSAARSVGFWVVDGIDPEVLRLRLVTHGEGGVEPLWMWTC